MRATLQSNALADALKSAATPRTTTLDVLQFVHLSAAEDGRLRVRSYDTEQDVVTLVPATIEDPTPTLLKGDALRAAVSVPGEITLQGDGTVKRGRSRYRIESRDAHELPDLSSLYEPREIDVDGPRLAAALRTVAYAARPDDVREFCRGVHLVHGCAWATDGARLAGVPSGYAGPPMLLHQRHVDRVASMLDGASSLTVGNMREGRAGALRVVSGNESLSVVLLSSGAPDFAGACAFAYDSARLRVDARALRDRLRAFDPFCTVTQKAKLALCALDAGDDVRIEGRDDNVDDITAMVIEREGRARVGIALRQVCDALGAVGTEHADVYLSESSPNNPKATAIVVRPVGDDAPAALHVSMHVVL